MNRKLLISLFVVPLLLIMAGVIMAGVNVGVSIGLPPVYTFAGPPELVVIPNTYVYYPPAADLDIVFYGGYWYRPYNGYWYRSAAYNGPWGHIGTHRVPRYIIDLPPNYRTMYRDYPRIPHHHVHDNWRHWQKEKYWNKREWKHEPHEWQERRGHKGGHHEERRGHGEERREHR